MSNFLVEYTCGLGKRNVWSGAGASQAEIDALCLDANKPSTVPRPSEPRTTTTAPGTRPTPVNPLTDYVPGTGMNGEQPEEGATDGDGNTTTPKPGKCFGCWLKDNIVGILLLLLAIAAYLNRKRLL